MTSTVVHNSEFYRTLPAVDFSLADASETDVSYKYFQDALDARGTELDEKTVRYHSLNKTLPTVLLMHGWTTDDTSPWFSPLKTEFFKKGPHNIIYINWSKAGNKSYEVSAANVQPVGRFIAEFLKASGVLPQNIQLIGHSLGSQLAGYTGKHFKELTGEKLGRITALDPAGPKFLAVTYHKKLNHHDANFVDVIHTDIEYFGYAAPIGHVDFYPNFGKHQPGCPTRSTDDNCSHARSLKYFIESVAKSSKAIKAVYSEIQGALEVKAVEPEECTIFGQNVPVTARGVYLIETNAQSPYLK